MADDDYKERVKNAVGIAAKKALKEYQKPTRQNEKPEKEVEKKCMPLMRSWGWTVEVYESKATYDPRRGRYISQSMKQGTLDCMGVTNTGNAVAVEFKAPGCLRNILLDKKKNQYDFLISRIKQYAFACVVDSPELLREHRNRWEFLRKTENLDASRDYLLSVVPKK